MSCSRSASSKLKVRAFSTTCTRRATHYETLGLPEGASKAQIKSHFYKLSKLHHPDVSNDPNSRAIFQKASEAYAILSNERERRAYDRSLLHRSPAPAAPFHPRAPPTKTARATYAWETRRPGPKSGSFEYAFSPPSARSKASSAQTSSGQTYTRPAHIDILTGNRKRAEVKQQELDKIHHSTTFARPLQVVALILVGIGLMLEMS
ncbi:DnaJ domain-containing protein [Gymnopilus junonius]|uniref:DnaJ domain-containing protein n=1 Tax=Gymnopilus junonius TaxID=109634 RepID=A0A9P5TLW0_GYMJU|nr:DnaJ domain-containing protein [Gymnopilus junonius]